MDRETNEALDLSSLVTDEDMVGILIRENTRLAIEKAELEVIIEKLVEYIDKNDVLPTKEVTEMMGEGTLSPSQPNPKHRGI